MNKPVAMKTITSEVLWSLAHTKWLSVHSKRDCRIQVDLDYTVFHQSSRRGYELRNDLNLDLLKLQDWLYAKKISLNVVKTQSLIIGSDPNILRIEGQPDAPPSVSIGDQDIEMITNTRYLHFQIDSNLNCEKHINTIKIKANRALGLIKNSKKYLPSDVLNKMHRGIVEPHLSMSYRCSVLGCCNESKIDALQKIQNRASRIETSSPYDALDFWCNFLSGRAGQRGQGKQEIPRLHTNKFGDNRALLTDRPPVVYVD